MILIIFLISIIILNNPLDNNYNPLDNYKCPLDNNYYPLDNYKCPLDINNCLHNNYYYHFDNSN